MASTRVHVTNPTKIISIPGSVVEISIFGEGADESMRATFDSLSRYVPDPTLRVWIWAGAGNTSKAFDYGKAGKLIPPADTKLADLDPEKPRTFRLTVWDPVTKRIVASNERLRMRHSEVPSDAVALLPVRPASLGGEIWRLALQPEMPPELLVNQDIPAIKLHLRDKPELYAAIIPEAVRQSLVHLANNLSFDQSDEDAWQVKWVRFVQLMGAEVPDAAEKLSHYDALAWADNVIRTFAKEKHFARTMAEVLGSVDVD